MIQTVKLSKRLKVVASFLSTGTFFADIGSDHAYLPCYVCLNDKTARAVAGEVNKGPFDRALKTVAKYKLSDLIDVRLGDGLNVLNNEEVCELVIAGMGGSLITRLLEDGEHHLNSVKRIIAQPNINAKSVRKLFDQNGFILTQEAIIEEDHQIYEILIADKGIQNNPYSDRIKEKQLLFGPILLNDKSKTFLKKWKYECENMEKIISQMKQAKAHNDEKLIQFEKELKWIKEVLKT